jgi:adenylylsulfate kinase-like enzyme
MAEALRDKLTGSVFHLDGDIVRKSLSSDLGFEHSDRLENVRRIASLAKIIHYEIGAKVDYLIVSSIAPLEVHRDLIRATLEDVVLIYLKSSLSECRKRDVKGLYKSGALKISEFEEPTNGTVIPTDSMSVRESANLISLILKHYGHRANTVDGAGRDKDIECLRQVG